MSDIVEEIAPATSTLNGAFTGVFAQAASDFSDPVYVNLDLLGDAPLRVGPCRWQSRDATSLPARGDTCLVLFTNDQEPWVIAWWPFDL